MARVTVEDCIDKVDNRFDLVLFASHRATEDLVRLSDHRRAGQRQEPGGGVTRNRGHNHFARGSQGGFVHSLQKYVEVDEPEPEAVPLTHGRRRCWH